MFAGRRGELVACPTLARARRSPALEEHTTSLNTRGVPPARSSLASSMLSAPHVIAAMIEVSLPAGFTAPDLTPVDGRSTCSRISAERPVCSASSSTGTNPAADNRFCCSIPLTRL